MGIGQNIRRMRKEAGMSQEQLAAKIGKTRSAVSYYESGDIVPRMGVIEELAQIFHCRKSDIIDTSTSYSVVTLNETSIEERELVEIMRTITPEGKKQLLIFARGIAETYRAQ